MVGGCRASVLVGRSGPRIGISKGLSAGTSGARPPEHLSTTRLRYAPLGCARTRPARGRLHFVGTPEPGLERRSAARAGAGHAPQDGGGSAAGVPEISGTVWGRPDSLATKDGRQLRQLSVRLAPSQNLLSKLFQRRERRRF